MLLNITGKCHTCGKQGEPPPGQEGQVKGVPWCSKRCEARARFDVGDTVVLDSGYTNGENGIVFKVEGKDGDEFYGRVRGKRVQFIKEQAAKFGTKRAEAIINQRQLQKWKESSKYGK